MLRTLLAATLLFLPGFAAPLRAQQAEAEQVDVELGLLVDVSRSMSPHELEIQRRGYAEALTSPEVLGAIGEGFLGKIAVAYIEWAGVGSQRVVVDWTTIAGPDDAKRVADELTSDFTGGLRRTSISSAITFGTTSILANQYKGLRQVLDISGDGPNNQGPPVTGARDIAVTAGLVINGLPLMTGDSDYFSAFSIQDLDRYYQNCVIGGPGAFALPVKSWDDFPDAVRRKLIVELAGQPLLQPAQARAQPAEDYDCLIGEKIWQRRNYFNQP